MSLERECMNSCLYNLFSSKSTQRIFWINCTYSINILYIWNWKQGCFRNENLNPVWKHGIKISFKLLKMQDQSFFDLCQFYADIVLLIFFNFLSVLQDMREICWTSSVHVDHSDIAFKASTLIWHSLELIFSFISRKGLTLNGNSRGVNCGWVISKMTTTCHLRSTSCRNRKNSWGNVAPNQDPKVSL